MENLDFSQKRYVSSELYMKLLNLPVKIIEKNGHSNAVLGVRTLQSRSNGLNDVLIPKLNTVIVLNDARSLQEDGTACLNVVLGT